MSKTKDNTIVDKAVYGSLFRVGATLVTTFAWLTAVHCMGTVLRDASDMAATLQEWEDKGLPSTLSWRARHHLAGVQWLGPLRPRLPLDPLDECGVQVRPSWWSLLLRPGDTRGRLACLQQQVLLAEKEHKAFHRNVSAVLLVMVCTVVLLGLMQRRAGMWRSFPSPHQDPVVQDLAQPAGEAEEQTLHAETVTLPDAVAEAVTLAENHHEGPVVEEPELHDESADVVVEEEILPEEEEHQADEVREPSQQQGEASALRRPPPPWLCPPPHYDGSLRALDQEVRDFQRWAGGSEAELRRRMSAVEDLRRVVASLWPEARVMVTGSLANGLYLPDSDVDVTLLGHWPASPPPLMALRDALLQHHTALPSKVTVLDKARVPLVKFVHAATGLPLDVSLGNEAAVRAAGLVRELVHRFPGLAPLSMLVRHYLRGLGLAEVYSGGVSSYAVTLMSASLLQLQVPRDLQNDLGWLLLRFFWFYGYDFPYRSKGISVVGGGRYLRKEEVPVVMPGGHRRSALCIQDPFCATNDLGMSSFRIWHVRNAFQRAHRVLAAAVDEPGTYVCPDSLLGLLLAGQNTPQRAKMPARPLAPWGERHQQRGTNRRPGRGWRRGGGRGRGKEQEGRGK